MTPEGLVQAASEILLQDDEVHGQVMAVSCSPDRSAPWNWGPCLVFAEALVMASDGRLELVGLKYDLVEADEEEGDGGYEHIVAYDPVSGLYLDGDGTQSLADLLASYRLKPSFEEVYGEPMVEPFRESQATAIWSDPELTYRAADILRRSGIFEGWPSPREPRVDR